MTANDVIQSSFNQMNIQYLKSLLKNKNWDSAKQYAEKVELEMKTNTPLHHQDRFLAYYYLFKYYLSTREIDQAIKNGRLAILYTRNIGDPEVEKLIIDHYLQFSILEREQKHYSSARAILAKLIERLDKQNRENPIVYGLVYSNLGKIAFEEEDYVVCSNHLECALYHFNQLENQKLLFIKPTIEMLAETYIQMENYEKSVERYEELLSYYETEENHLEFGRGMLKIGTVYFHIHLKTARKKIKSAIDIFEKVANSQIEMAKAYFLLAEIEENLNNFPRAINYFQRGIEPLSLEIQPHQILIVYAYFKMGTLSLLINKNEDSKIFLEKGLLFADPFPKIKQKIIEQLEVIYPINSKVLIN